MQISDLSVRRPIVAIVASLLLTVFGLYAAAQMAIRETPNIDRPNVSISVTYPGAAAEVVETKIVKLIEDQISGISGIKAISSTSRDGNGNISIEFNEDRDIEGATNDVRDQVSRVVSRLPEDANPPVIQKADSDAESVLFVSLWSSTRSPLELTEYAIRVLQPRLAAIDGVAYVSIAGARQKAMRIWLNRQAMAARNVTSSDIEAALRRENIELGAGMIESKDRNITMRTVRTYQTPEEFNNLVVARGPNNYLVKLGEVARVELGPVDQHGVYRNRGQQALGLGIIKQPGASTLDVAKRVKEELVVIKKTLPPDLDTFINSDNSVYIATALKEVTIAAGIAALLVMMVIYLFLGTVRAAIIPAVTVPISLVATAMVLWPADFSINILTLLAVVLAIGLVVDDAIIVLENIHRRMKAGEPAILASLRGSRQVGMAVVSTTLVLAAAFIPIALLKGSVGSLFKEFAVTMAVSVGFSMFVSLTLTPVMCSKILTPDLDESKVAHKAEEIFERLKRLYARILNRTLDHPRLVMAGFAGLIALTALMFAVVPQEFTPREDRGQFFIQIRAPEGSNTEYTDRQVKQAAETLKPYVESGVISRYVEQAPSGSNNGSIIIMLSDWSERDIGPTEIGAAIAPKLSNITGGQVAVSYPTSLGRGGGGYGAGVTLVVGGPTYEELRVWRDALMDVLTANPKFLQVRNNFVETKPEIRIQVDRVRASDLGVSVNTIGQTLAAMLGSRRVTTFVDDGEEYDVIIQSDLAERRSPTDISNIYVRSDTTRQLVPLSSVVAFHEGSYANGLNRLDRRRAVTFSIFPAPGVLLGDVIKEVEQVAAQKLPDTAELTWRGEAGDFKDNSSAIYFSFGLALLVVFLVLAAQFESFIHPLVVMMTVPLAVAGAVLGLLATGQSINLYSQIGIIVLVGLAAKNGILIVEFANQLRDAGREFRDALVEAALIRFRPIVMTSLATVMGAVPLIVATGAGAESRRPIGIVIFAGVSFATLITLIVIPTVYALLARKTGSPGRVAAEIRREERRFPEQKDDEEAAV